MMIALLKHGHRVEMTAETEEEKEYIKLIKNNPKGLIPKAVLPYGRDELYFYFTDEVGNIVK